MTLRILTLLLSTLLFAAPAAAKKTPQIPGGALDALAEGVLGKQWECVAPVDLRKKDRGPQVCLHTLAVDPATGESAVVVEMVDDQEDHSALDDMVIELTLGLRGGDRIFRAFHVEPMDDADGKLDGGRVEDDDYTRRRYRVVFSYRTWDPTAELEDVKLRVKGYGKARWKLDERASHDGAWAARATLAVDAGAGVCTVGKVGPAKAEKLDDLLEDHGPGGAFVMEYLVPAADEGRVHFEVKDPKFYVEFDDGKLIVHGSETLKWKLGSVWNEKGDDNVVRLSFDGEDALVEVNGAAFGPMYVAQRTWKRSPMRWDVELEKAGGRISGLQIGPCDGAEVPKALRPKEADTVADATPKAEGRRVASGGAKSEERPAERKPKPSALDVLTAIGRGASIAQGAATATAQGVDAAQTMEGNVDAMNDGRYEDMESFDYRVNVGEDGSVDSSYRKSGAGGATVSQSVGDAESAVGQIVVVNNARDGVVVFVDGEEVGESAPEGMVQIAASGGSHRVELRAGGMTVWSGTVTVKLAGSVAIERGNGGKVEVTSVGF